MRIDALMRISHKIIEMRTAFAFDRQKLEEHIHQHGLAATNFAMNIKSFDGGNFLALAKQPAKRTRFARKTFGANFLDQPVIACSQFKLCGIGFDLACLDQRVIMLANRGNAFKLPSKDMIACPTAQLRKGGASHDCPACL